MVYDLERYQWSDEQWMAERPQKQLAPERDQHLRSAISAPGGARRRKGTAS